MEIFTKNKKYSFNDIAEICDKNGLTTVDCLKDENMISVEGYENGELSGNCISEFHQIKEDVFKLTWQE
ncbi:MAG: hypothetical protein NT155_03480 [Candidatus Staskawiczbacteria bacterium]|nr:hypothetical protein [Candidatus Staskawiczbacteria bacterium]